MKAVNVGLLGLGTVGGGTLKVLRRNADEISRRAGREIRVAKAAVRDPSRARDLGGEPIALTGDALEIVNDPGIDIVVELIGGDGIAKDAVLR
ncbi:MAG: homoserine dehydrogenase, partial [bacterium]